MTDYTYNKAQWAYKYLLYKYNIKGIFIPVNGKYFK
jgi:hypothetical protein